MEKSTQLLQNLRNRLLEENRSNSGFIEVDAETMRTLQPQPAPDFSKPGAFDYHEDQPELTEATPAPFPVDGPLSPEELEWLSNGDLISIFQTSPEEIPQRLHPRIERLIADRQERRLRGPHAWMA